MILFNCPKCGRHYQVSQALRHLPLICKGCGERIEVPETSQVLEPEPVLAASPAPTAPSIASSVAAASDSIPPAPTKDKSQEKDDPIANHIGSDSVAITAPAASDTRDAIPVLPVPETQADATNSEEAPGESTPEISPRMTRLAIAVDVLVGFVLLVFGGLLGEVLAKKSTVAVFWDATASVRFPPIDLMLWLAPPTLLLLIHVLLISRKKSVGAWLQRRRETRVT